MSIKYFGSMEADGKKLPVEVGKSVNKVARKVPASQKIMKNNVKKQIGKNYFPRKSPKGAIRTVRGTKVTTQLI